MVLEPDLQGSTEAHNKTNITFSEIFYNYQLMNLDQN